jgi:hypothetical protein
MNHQQVAIRLIEENLEFSINQIETMELHRLQLIHAQLKLHRNNYKIILKHYINKESNIKTTFVDGKKLGKTSEYLDLNDVIAMLENGTFLGRKSVYFCFRNENDFSLTYDQMANVEWFKVKKLFSSTCGFRNPAGFHVGIDCESMDKYESFFKNFVNFKNSWLDVIDNISERLQNQISIIKDNNLILERNKYLSILDQDANGHVDLVANDFPILLNKYQRQIIEIDKNYIQKFIQISNFIKAKKQNTQKIFETILSTSNQEELEDRVMLLRNQIHAYNILVFHSINMLGSLIAEDLITFYEIHESFDKLGMFNTNWENEVSEKLTNIGDKLDDLMHSIHAMEQNIVSELSNLSYVTQQSFENLNMSVSSQLQGIESSLNMNSLLAGIQAYQLYKLNKSNSELKP